MIDPAVSVLIVSDYASGGPEGWKDVRHVIAQLARQDFDEPIEFLLCESERFRASVPDLHDALPTLKLVWSPELAAYGVKNDGVRAASSPFVAIIDADCVPDTTWLRRLVTVLRARPDVAAVSGRTTYPGQSFFTRACGLLGRAYIDPGGEGPTRFIAINNCAFRRDAFLSSLLPTSLGTFSSTLQSDALRRAGWTLWFDPAIQVLHHFDGWAMEVDFRQNCGHGTIRTRLENPQLPYGWLMRIGRAAIPPIVAGKIIDSWRDCVRCGPAYGIRWFELPAAMLTSIGLHLLEVPGMLRAFHKTGLRSSAFR